MNPLFFQSQGDASSFLPRVGVTEFDDFFALWSLEDQLFLVESAEMASTWNRFMQRYYELREMLERELPFCPPSLLLVAQKSQSYLIQIGKFASNSNFVVEDSRVKQNAFLDLFIRRLHRFAALFSRSFSELQQGLSKVCSRSSLDYVNTLWMSFMAFRDNRVTAVQWVERTHQLDALFEDQERLVLGLLGRFAEHELSGKIEQAFQWQVECMEDVRDLSLQGPVNFIEVEKLLTEFQQAAEELIDYSVEFEEYYNENFSHELRLDVLESESGEVYSLGQTFESLRQQIAEEPEKEQKLLSLVAEYVVSLESLSQSLLQEGEKNNSQQVIAKGEQLQADLSFLLQVKKALKHEADWPSDYIHRLNSIEASLREIASILEIKEA